MKNSKISKTGAVMITLLLLIGMMQVFSATSENNVTETRKYSESVVDLQDSGDENNGVCQKYDTIYIPEEDVSLAGEQNDIGYNICLLYTSPSPRD